MYYRDLVQFEPIETIIKINAADNKQAAAALVESYIISDRMADQLVHLVLPQLRIDRPVDNKGVLIVGNYGTGKSHLMSFISALAEHADLLSLVRHTAVRQAAEAFAGRFQVVRIEIGGVESSLRDIVLGELERFFAAVGTPFTFPPASQITNNKGPIIQAIATFNQRYPNTGMLFVCDEMLDFLRTREERALILDLGFLRELGEVSAVTPFRFVGGLQEALFDNPRFSFVAEQLRRVRDRFEQVRIARDDIAYVVANRLLNKNAEQLARITEHLRRFVALYPGMAERLDEYARLFPIHPAYIDTFEKVYIAEKREVLKTFSAAIRTLLDREVPSNETGLISYDHYWSLLREDPSLRTLPNVVDVVEKSSVLESRIRNAYTRKQLQPMALRIIHALSVHRLTTSDIHAPLGVTAEELRDQLCLWTSIPEQDAGFLADTIQVALKEILRTVSGQYISHNAENGQYFLNLKKTIDFDARIAERGNFMEERDLNRYFYDALLRLFNLNTSTHVSGFQIWPYELPWDSHKVMRPGYLFFMPPNERSTAQPPRDFYIYILPPFGATNTRPVARPDEVIFQFHDLQGDFAEIVRRYAGAQALTGESPDNRQEYENKAADHLRALVVWLRQNMASHVRVTTGNTSRSVPEVLAKTRSSASRDAEELLRVVAAQELSKHFESHYPEYPAFVRLSQIVTERNRGQNAMEAARVLAGRTRTVQATAILDGLHLLDENDQIKPLNPRSKYARYFLDTLLGRGETQVVNHGDIIEQVAGGLEPVFKDTKFQLETEWVAVILLALVYDGQITLNLGSDEKLLDAGTIDRAATQSIEALADFRFYRRPKSLPLPVWSHIFDGLGLQSSLIRDESQRDDALRQLQTLVRAELPQVVEWQSRVGAGITLWNQPLFTDRFTFQTQSGQVLGTDAPAVTLSQNALLPYLRKTKEFLELLARFDTAGKLRNLTMTLPEAEMAIADRAVALRARDVLEVVAQLQPLAAYLGEASAVLSEDHPWVMQALTQRDELLSNLRRLAKGEQSFDLAGWRRRLEQLKREYVVVYSEVYTREVLGPADDDRRTRLLNDTRVGQLRQLARVDILNTNELRRWEELVKALPAGREFHSGQLEMTPTYRNFRPSRGGGPTATQRLDMFAQQLDRLGEGWHAALRQNLQSATAQESIARMRPEERQPIDQYVAANPLDMALTDSFVQVVNQALRGIRAVALKADGLLEALQTGGMPCTVEELRQRFEAYVRRTMSGNDPSNTRLTIEQE